MSRPALCPACGETRGRRASKFCRTCGRALAVAEYLPTDNLRASYRERRSSVALAVAATDKTSVKIVANTATVKAKRDAPPQTIFQDAERNTWSAVALAFATYALVPYLGILFCPGALVAGGLGLARARRLPHEAGRRAAQLSICLTLAVCVVQLLLWLILFRVPDWQR